MCAFACCVPTGKDVGDIELSQPTDGRTASCQNNHNNISNHLGLIMQMELHQFVCNQGGRISLTLQPHREITNNEQSARVITIPSSSQMSFVRNQPDAYLCE
jgi:hypothetical protein